MNQQPAGPEVTAVPVATAPATASAPGAAAVPEAAGGDVTVSVNGAARAVPAGTDLGTLVATLTPARAGVAAAVNESVVPRGRWAATTLGEGDRVEVLTAVQGG